MLWIHIGLRKAGSSTLQSFLKTNQEALGRLGLRYPSQGLFVNSHHDLVAELRDRRPNKEDNGWAALARSMEGDTRTACVSSEMFEPLEQAQIQKIPGYFPADQKFTVLAVVRSPVDLLPSIYSQRTKTGANRLDFDQYFDQVLAVERISFYQTLEAWAQVFGWGAIRVRVLDRQHLYQGDLVADALRLLLPEADPAALAQLERVPSRNISPGWKVVEMMREHVCREWPERAKGRLSKEEVGGRLLLKQSLNHRVLLEIAEQMGTLADKGLYMTRPQAELSLARYKEDVEKINLKLTQDQIPAPRELDASGFKERTFLPDVSHVPAEQRAEFASLRDEHVQRHRERIKKREKKAAAA